MNVAAERDAPARRNEALPNTLPRKTGARGDSGAGDRLVVGSPCQFWTDCLHAALRQHLAWEVIPATGSSRRLLQVATSVQARALLMRLDSRERRRYQNRRPTRTVLPFSVLAIDELPRPRPATVLHEGRFNWVPCHWRVGDLAVALTAWQRGTVESSATRAQPDAIAPPNKHPWSELTHRELQVCLLLAQGFSVRECARELGLRPSTVDNHKTHLMRKLGVHKTTELVRLAIRDRLVDFT